jgi:hypothetical protein
VSVPVDLGDLAAHVAERGTVAYLLTTSDDGRPHAVSTAFSVTERGFKCEAGNRTATNVEQRALVSLLWPARDGDDYSLIVDGDGTLVGGNPWHVVVRPTRAVLHRQAGCLAIDLPAHQ